MFHRSTMAENLDLTPSCHFFNRLLTVETGWFDSRVVSVRQLD